MIRRPKSYNMAYPPSLPSSTSKTKCNYYKSSHEREKPKINPAKPKQLPPSFTSLFTKSQKPTRNTGIPNINEKTQYLTTELPLQLMYVPLITFQLPFPHIQIMETTQNKPKQNEMKRNKTKGQINRPSPFSSTSPSPLPQIYYIRYQTRGTVDITREVTSPSYRTIPSPLFSCGESTLLLVNSHQLTLESCTLYEKSTVLSYLPYIPSLSLHQDEP